MSKTTDIIYELVAITIRTILRINGGFEVIGKENIPSEGGVLVAANHISYLDPPLVGSLLPRRATFMARHGLFDIPVLGWIIKGAAFPVDRERTRPSTIKETVRRLKSGELIVIFPEGRRNESGELMEAKRGVGMIGSLSRAPVVPVLIVGSDKALPVNAKWLKRAKVTVVIGKPIYYNSITDGANYSGHELHEEISIRVMTAIREMQKKYEN
ncbi:MAG: 1-acyl-sn-glycerol-3-phosphate acyltransferase [Nitrospiraceae bacterium]|nr:MAG: 1-acyl-sn-glycerol-3-phosphate acyltransferase [Nitrospiraceae bacterium]